MTKTGGFCGVRFGGLLLLYFGGEARFKDQLRNVQQIHSRAGAFAAILGRWFVVTWGHPGSGGDSSAVQEQLRNVQQFHSPAGALAAILDYGLLCRWATMAVVATAPLFKSS